MIPLVCFDIIEVFCYLAGSQPKYPNSHSKYKDIFAHTNTNAAIPGQEINTNIYIYIYTNTNAAIPSQEKNINIYIYIFLDVIFQKRTYTKSIGCERKHLVLLQVALLGLKPN